ncbi:MAG: TolC family protein [Bryobacteraceae bacterium]|nr:TolC family protein [Bryobacteraceae bacterium]
MGCRTNKLKRIGPFGLVAVGLWLTPSPAPCAGPLVHSYQAKPVPPVNLANSDRLDSLIRAGRLYVSLSDAIALALENNLDLELRRYDAFLAGAELRRAQAGTTPRMLVSPGGTLTAPVTSSGTAVPSLDPVIVSEVDRSHLSQPLTNAFSTGTNYLFSDSTVVNMGIEKGFLTGTTVRLDWENNWVKQNSPRADFNPYTTASVGLTLRQPVLKGFGVALNSRFIRIARNNQRVTEEAFAGQVMAVVSSVATLYWDLVSLGEEVDVRRQTFELAHRLLEDNRQRLELGSLAEIEVVRSQAELARAQQEVTIAETALRQQETRLKDVLTRTGVVSTMLSEVRVVPTDRLRIPGAEPPPSIRELAATALQSRPEIEQARLEVENSQLTLKGTKSALLPSLDFVASMRNNALAGEVNPLPVSPPGSTAPPAPRDSSIVDPFFLGGYGTAFSQILARNFPDYAVGFQLTIPLRNRAARAEMERDQLLLRQQEIRRQQLEKSIEVEVDEAVVAMEQARARYRSAAEFREFQERTLRAEQDRYELGASTTFFLIQAQRDLAQARSAEIAALSAHTNALIELDQATGRTLAANNIVIDEALQGRVTRPAPVAIPSPGSETDRGEAR